MASDRTGASRILLASHNAHKADEIRSMLPPGLELITLRDIGWTAPLDEPHHTFRENALAKARAVSGATGLPVLADDSGLEIDALDGRPGVFSARYAGAAATDAENVEKVLREMDGVTNRTARFRAVLAYVRPGQPELVFDGTVEGEIALQIRGEGGFGYDPVFIPGGFADSFGVLPASLKNRISHRAMALRKWISALADL